MSSRDPMWYCYECHSEMRPLMVPDPHCASCNGTFVEKMDNPTDDPRDYQNVLGDIDDDPFGPDHFFMTLQDILRSRPGRPQTPLAPNSPSRTSPHPRRTTAMDEAFGFQGGLGSRSPRRGTASSPPPFDAFRRTAFGRDDLPPRPTRSPTSSEGRTLHGHSPGPYEINRTRTRDSDVIPPPMMLHYLLSMMASRPAGGGTRGPDFLQNLFPVGAQDGRWGDYVFNQEALDQIITQIMENSSSRPVAATEEVTEKLPREVLEIGSPLLEKDCAVCKDQFSLKTEDPGEQVVVTLPCNHPFHETCIMPWLKSSATCPVCRHELLPQPHHDHSNPGAPGPSNTSPGPSNSSSPSPEGGGGSGSRDGMSGSGGGLFGSLFNILNPGGGSRREGSDERPVHERRGSSGLNSTRRSGIGSGTRRARSTEGRDDEREFPGGYHWDAGVD